MNKELSLSSAEMRQLGYQVIDIIIDHFDSLPDKPVLNIGSPESLRAQFDQALPEQPGDVDSVLSLVRDQILKNISHGDHPRFFAFIPGPSNFVGAMADALAAGFNVCASNWLEASGPAEIERICIRWLCDLCALPPESGGTFLSGGSMANLTAIAVARHIKLGQADSSSQVYYADQAHMSISRGLRVLGFASHQMTRISTNNSFRMDTDLLRTRIEQDKKEGQLPFCVIATAGTTNTGAVDNLAVIAEICQANNMWLHVDGAFGAGAILSVKGQQQLKGIELADSITIDPHKWLFQPIETGCLLVRDQRNLRQTFDESPEYLSDVDAADEEINFYQHTVQLTRQTRALKLWMSLHVFGAQAFREAIDSGFANAEYIENRISGMTDWEIVTRANLGIVTFRHAPADYSATELNELNQSISDRLSETNLAFVATTILKGVKTLRMCPINPRTTRSDIDNTLAQLDRIASDITGHLS
ncbi:MAG: aminotransferase class I/II-fold pyridoxal phosphate-dependent enzyme [Gammaproteobacteria bacterium]|nr:aminotransferase class I/II-fold pyridoxal phosphate-dependent enzyme [Gammaproteobacteria bacterium]